MVKRFLWVPYIEHRHWCLTSKQVHLQKIPPLSLIVDSLCNRQREREKAGDLYDERSCSLLHGGKYNKFFFIPSHKNHIFLTSFVTLDRKPYNCGLNDNFTMLSGAFIFELNSLFFFCFTQNYVCLIYSPPFLVLDVPVRKIAHRPFSSVH